MSERSNWKLTLAYDGTDFHGWQIQPGKSTVQGTLADAIAAVTCETVLPQGAGRTDAGVHACGQVASFSLTAAIPAENLRRALNRVLPQSIRVTATERVSKEFHARHCSTGKVYEYRVFHGEICPPFLTRYVTCRRGRLNLDAMQSGADAILGEHDFTSFAASDPDRTTRTGSETVDSSITSTASDAAEMRCHRPELNLEEPARTNIRRIEQSEWRREVLPVASADVLNTIFARTDANTIEAFIRDEPAEILTYTIRGNGFLHHMVRNLVGTMLEIGRGHFSDNAMTHILKGRNRRLAGPTAPASGLCLMRVFY